MGWKLNLQTHIQQPRQPKFAPHKNMGLVSSKEKQGPLIRWRPWFVRRPRSHGIGGPENLKWAFALPQRYQTPSFSPVTRRSGEHELITLRLWCLDRLVDERAALDK